MDQNQKNRWRNSLLASSAIVPVLFAATGAGAQSSIVAAPGTTVDTPSSSVFNISTSKTNAAGTSAFNQFTTFMLDAGDTANLKLPGIATRLFNIVQDNKIIIDGTVNSYLNDGSVGGHVIFASPKGIMVGESGVLNTGSLTFVTPSAQFLSDNVAAGGLLSDLAAANLAHGRVALSDTGAINIAGKINAPDGAVFASSNILLATASFIKTDTVAVGDAVFDAVVQTAGALTRGGSLVERDGAVEIIAAASENFEGLPDKDSPYSRPTAQAEVTINGDISAKGIFVSADTNVSSEYGAESVGAMLNVAIDKSLYGFAVAIVEAEAKAKIVVGSTATLISTDGVDISASTQTSVTADAAAAGSTEPVSLAITVADIDATAEALVKSGAVITAGGDFSLSATNLSSISNTASTEGNSNAATVALTFADIGAAAIAESGAMIDANNVNLTALNQNSFSTEASSTAGANGLASLVFAFADTNSDSVALLGANTRTSAASVVSVSIEAASITTENKVSASATANNSSSSAPPRVDVTADSAVLNTLATKISEITAKSPEAGKQVEGASPSKAKVAVSTAINLSDQSARAAIESVSYTPDSDGLGIISTGSSAPKVYSSDAVSIYAETRDDVTRLFANSEASAATEEDGSSNALTIAGSITVGLFNYDTHAEIGEGVTVEAGRVGVGAVSEKLFGFTLLDSLALPEGNVQSIYGFFDGLRSRSEDPALALPSDLFTSYAASSSTTEQNNAFAGNISFTEFEQDTRAWIDSGATVTAAGSDAGVDFTTQLTSLDPDVARQVDWWLASSGENQTDVIVTARSLAEGVHVTGKVDLTGASSVQSGSNAIGGSVGIVHQKSTTIAGIADGAVVTTDRALSVLADATSRFVTLTPTSGEGGGLTGVGLVNVISIDNQTNASISNLARVKADTVSIEALQQLTSWSVAAVRASGEGVSIGISGAVNLIDTDTQAFVGDNTGDDQDAPLSPTAPPGPFPGDTGPTNKVITRDLRVRAKTSGEAGTLAVAGSSSGKSTNKGESKLGFEDKTQGAPGAMGLVDTQKQTDTNSKTAVDSDDPMDKDVLSTITDVTSELTDSSGNSGGSGMNGAQGSQQPKFGFAASGSATVSLNKLTTLAYVDSANIEGQSANADSVLIVEALTDTDQISVSGAAALARGGPNQKFSGAISGAVAYQISENQNDAAIRNSNISEIDSIDVRALTGGLRVGAALGLSASVGKNQNAAAIAGSFSIARVADSSDARISGSTISAADADSFTDIVNVDAYNRNTIGIGAGSIAYGGRVSAAGGVTYAEIANRQDGNADGSGLASYAGILNSSITDYDVVNVRAINAAQTIGVGIVGAVATGQSFAISGSVVINVIDADAKAQIGGDSIIAVDDGVSVVSGGGDIAVFDTLLAGDREGGRETNEYEVKIGSSATDDGQLNFGSNADTPSSFGTGAKAFALSGAVAFGRASAGFAVSVNDISSDRTAIIDSDGTSITAANFVDVIADNQSEILSLSVAGAASTGQFAGTGSVTVNLIDDDTIAQIGDASTSIANQTTISAQNITVSAKGSGDISSLAGSISASTGGAAVGASVAVNEITGSVNATIVDTELLDADALIVRASTSDLANASDEGAIIRSLAVAGSASAG